MRRLRFLLFAIFIFAISFLLHPSHASAATKYTSVFDQPYIQVTPPGLSSQVAFSVYKDKDGFIWVGNRNGVDRYDGIYYTHYGLGHNQMRSMHTGMQIFIYCDNQGDIWAFTERSDIYRYDRTEDAFVEIIYLPDYQIYGSTQAIFCEGDLLVIGATDGITCYDIPTKTIVKRLCPDDDIHYFCKFRDGELFYGATRGLGILNLNDMHGALNQWVSNDVKSIYYEEERQRLWVGSTGNGLYVLDPLHPKTVQKVESTADFIITDITPLNEHEMLVSADGVGVLVIPSDVVDSKSTWRCLASGTIDTPFPLRSSGVRDVEVDNGHIWIASFMGGVTCLQPGSSLTQLNADHLQFTSDNYAYGVDVAPDGRFWVAFTQSIGSFAPDGSDVHMYLEHAGHFLTIRAASDGTIWCGGYNAGTYHLDPKTGKYEHFPSLTDQHVLDCVYDIYEDRAGDIWIGGLNFQLTRLHALPDNTYEKTHYPINLVNSIAQLTDDKMVISMTDGFYIVNSVTGECTKLLDDEAKWPGTNYISDARTRQGKEVWIATAGAGLVCYDLEKDSIMSFNLSHGLPSLELRGLSIVNDSVLYVSTENDGLFAFDCKTQSYLRGFMSSDGLSMTEFLQNSATTTKDGRILFGGDNGVVILEESDMYTNTQDFYICVTAQGLKDNTIQKGSDESHSIDFQVSTNDIYRQKEYNIYYRMKGVEEDWTAVDDSRHIRFSHLPAGFYELEIRAIGSGNRTSQRNITIEIEASSFWAAHIINIAYTLLAISLLCLFFTFRQYLTRKKEDKDK